MTTSKNKVEAFMTSFISAAFESPTFSDLCRHAVKFPSDENIWSLVAFERKILNSDMVMLLATSPACMNRLWMLLVSMESRCSSGRLVNNIDLLKMGKDVGLGLIDLAFPEDFFATAKAAEEKTRDAAKESVE
ncbi:hypothetical protein OSTOST_03700 [Ostertagia ostertagi]